MIKLNIWAFLAILTICLMVGGTYIAYLEHLEYVADGDIFCGRTG